MTALAIKTQGLGKEYLLGQSPGGLRTIRRIFKRQGPNYTWALHDVSIEIKEGEAVAIIGRNGAGKSTLLKILTRVTEPSMGYADIWGRVGSLLEVGTGFHPELTGRENVYLNGAILGMRRSEVARKFDDIVDFANVARYIDTPVKRYSSGMQVRLAFAVAAFLEPEILLVDEVLAVGDAEFQKRCLGRMSDVAQQGRTVLFVSHNMQAVRSFCQRGVLLDAGRVITDAPIEAAVRAYLASVDQPGAGMRRWETPPGDDNCRLLAVTVSGKDGLPSGTLLSDEPAVVSLEVQIGYPDPALCIGFDLVTADGVTVFESFHTDAPEADRAAISKGRNLVSCEIPAGLLNSGRYFVRPRIALYYVRWIVYAEAAVSFDVEYSHGESLFLNGAPRPGVTAPVLEWTSNVAAVTSQ